MRDRFCPVLEPDFRCCKAPFSFYRFIEKYCSSTETNRTLHRIFSLMRKMNAQTVVIEDLARKGELDREATAVEVRCGGSVDFKAWRFSFFTCPVTFDLLPYIHDVDYLGYAIFIDIKLPNATHRHYVYESVITKPSFHTNGISSFGGALPAHYIHCVRPYSGWIASHRFKISGSFFSQQNGLTHVCANAVLRWVLNTLPERAESIISYEEINQDLQIDHSTRKVGQYGNDVQAIGLPMDDLIKVLDKHGHKSFGVDYEQPAGKPQPYWNYIYSIIESGYPVLVFFTTRNARHVICAVGHTLNSDIWDEEARLAYSGAPRAEYFSTASWVDHFIIHDDNYGMYFSMPIKALSSSTTERKPFQITSVLGIVPAKIDLRPQEAELFVSTVLKLVYEIPLRSCYWLNALKQEDAAFGKWIVLRTLFTNKADYKQHLYQIEDVEGNTLKKHEISAIISEDVPDHFWITEITLTDIYTANKRKLGEVLFKLSDPGIGLEDSLTTYSKKLFDACIAIRLPANILIPKVSLKQISLTSYETDLIGHVPLLRTRCPKPPSEW